MTAPRLVATSWSSAGDASPMRSPGASPVPIAERITAIADAGFCGFGLGVDDVIAVRASIGFATLRDLIADAGLVHSPALGGHGHAGHDGRDSPPARHCLSWRLTQVSKELHTSS